MPPEHTKTQLPFPQWSCPKVSEPLEYASLSLLKPQSNEKIGVVYDHFTFNLQYPLQKKTSGSCIHVGLLILLTLFGEFTGCWGSLSGCSAGFAEHKWSWEQKTLGVRLFRVQRNKLQSSQRIVDRFWRSRRRDNVKHQGVSGGDWPSESVRIRRWIPAFCSSWKVAHGKLQSH